MYLKALEIQGFKSFADKTLLSFEKEITAIVGPNGSGKSNISDAILWVMGEQRTKALRGSKMEDVIFGGTEIRSPMGFAQVSLILDNTAGFFPTEGSELMLTRRYYRSGDSEYYINKEPVRLKDINSLLMDTGLGRDGYSIIGQGRIDEIISTRSTDRREVFEEAAGISRFRYRKEEAERRLEKTEDNLLRINDKIEELELQVGPLKEQSEKAKKYLFLRDELRTREISVWLTTLDRLREQSEAVRQEYEQLSEEVEKSKKELEALYASGDSLTDRMHRKDVETEEARLRLSAAEARLSAADAEVAVLRANIESSRSSVLRIEEELEQQRGRLSEIREEMAKGEERLRSLEEEKRVLAGKQKQAENVLAGCRMKLGSREEMLQQQTTALNAAEVDQNSIAARIRILTDMQRDYEGYSKAVRTVMKEAGRGTLRAIHGPVSGLLRTESDLALAIETALGSAGQNIVVDTQNDARAAIELLQRQDAGRATFLPLDTIRGSRMAEVDDPGAVGIASDLVSYDPQYEQIVLNLLGRTLIAERLSDAIRISGKNGNKLRIVSMDGQMIHAGGSMTGGSSVRGSGILSRASELEKLQKDLERAKKKVQSAGALLENTRRASEKISYELQMAQEDQAELSRQEAALNAERNTTENARRQFQILLAALDGDSEQRRSGIAAAERQVESFQERLQEKLNEREEIQSEADKEKETIQRISSEKLELDGRRTRTDKQTQQLNADINELERRVSRAEQKKVTADMEEKQIIDKLWDNYELSYSTAEQVRQPVENLQKANREIGDLRRRMNALGTPNLGAIEEYERVNTRYEFLAGQRDDVQKAKTELVGIIRDITSEMESIFVERFHEIDACFRETFRDLFGGGKAALSLEDESRVLDCGIEIHVQPPGKAVSIISLLSGGEKAFVAIALYFAILRVRPTPFCVMDEIEAALDEENVNRYADYLRRYSDKTQFLIITHRRGTMEGADMLYGVTMQEKGVSSVLSLDLEAAKKTLEE
ncbi:MAG: AAA family ATPase [Oscillospiraceae bacterium]|nr:AAA family ATPase [Oscillospiraceae bacterium]